MNTKVNVAGIRETVRVMRNHGAAMYDQTLWGNEYNGFKAGSRSCNTPACFAGYVIATLGNDEGLRKHKGRFAWYAEELLRLPREWTMTLICATWPDQWLNSDETDILSPDGIEGKEPVYLIEGLASIKRGTKPTLQQAIHILERIAKQFERGQTDGAYERD